MRALFVAPYLPTPGSGGRTRLINLMERLARSHDLQLVAFHAPDQDPGAAGYPGRVLAPPPRRPRPGGLAGAVRFYRERLERLPAYAGSIATPRMHAAIREAVESFRPDVVQFETTEMGQYLSAAGREPLRALDLQDVASRWFARIVGKEQTRQQRALMALELAKTRRYETRSARAADVVFVASELERRALRRLSSVDAVEIPNGVDTTAFVPMPDVVEQPDRLVFVGPLTYDANLDGLRWFAGHVLPLIRRERPGVVVEVAGVPVEEDFGEGVRLLGWVDDVRPVVASAPVSIVPVRLGSGTRYKILEALSMQRCVVSTSTGAEGLGVVDGEHLLVADEPGTFAAAVLRALDDAALRARLGEAGRAHVLARYDWGPLVERVESAWGSALSRRASTR